MIGTALSYIRQRLNAHLCSVMGLEDDGSSAERLVFVDGDKLDPLAIPLGAIGMVVANVQEEREFREADRYARRVGHGQGSQVERHHPDLHLEITILFIAQFKDYANAWNQLSQLLFFFQEHPVFDPVDDQDLPAGIGRLVSELWSPTVQQQNELWSALKTSLRPSILVRFRLLTLRGKALVGQPVPIQTVETRLNPKEIQANLRSPPLAPLPKS
ncbi:MAG: Pvc16 family protein [Cyanobacteriota bacterium]|nr:Pvc16 family protein [Cyanobacteriota bacterium]